MGHVWYEYPCVAHGNAFCYAMRGITFLFYVPRVVRAPTRGTNPNLALTIVRAPAPTLPLPLTNNLMPRVVSCSRVMCHVWSESRCACTTRG